MGTLEQARKEFEEVCLRTWRSPSGEITAPVNETAERILREICKRTAWRDSETTKRITT